METKPLIAKCIYNIGIRLPGAQLDRPRPSVPNWITELTTPTRTRFMVVTPRLVEFLQGWAIDGTDLDLDLEDRLEIRGRSHFLREVQPIEIGDRRSSLAVSELRASDYSCMKRLLSDRRIKWYSLIPDMTEDIFPYDCVISVAYPRSMDDLDRAKRAYERELAIFHSNP